MVHHFCTGARGVDPHRIVGLIQEPFIGTPHDGVVEIIALGHIGEAVGALGGVGYGDTAGAGSLAVGGGGVNSGGAFTHSGEAHSGIRQAHLDHAFICGTEDVGNHRAFVIEDEYILGRMHLDGIGRSLHMRGDHLRSDGHGKSEVGRAGEGMGVHFGCGRREGLHPVAFSVPGIDAGDAH